MVAVLQGDQGPGETRLHEPDDRHLVHRLLPHGHRGRDHPDSLPPETVQHQAGVVRKHENENMKSFLGGGSTKYYTINTPGLLSHCQPFFTRFWSNNWGPKGPATRPGQI